MTEQSKIEERRQRIFAALWESADELPDDVTAGSLSNAIETATRVKITDDIARIHRLAWLEAYNERLIIECKQHGMARCPYHFDVIDVQKAALAMTLIELGFEVES